MSEADRYFIKKGFSKVIKQGIEEFTDDDGNYIHFDLVIERFTCNCYLSAKELQAINKKVEELRMDMSNRIGDENVANIEDDVELVKRYLENSAYKESDSDFFKNGGWEMVDLEIPKAMANILAEREQKDKRIQELEEENNKLKTHRKEFIKEKQELTTSLLDSLPKQTIIDKIAKLKNDYDEKYDLYMGYKIESRDQQDILKQMKILQELLKGEE